MAIPEKAAVLYSDFDKFRRKVSAHKYESLDGQSAVLRSLAVSRFINAIN